MALTRAIVVASLIGAAEFLAMWSQTDEVKVLVIASLTPFIGHILLRFGIEGVIDTVKK